MVQVERLHCHDETEAKQWLEKLGQKYNKRRQPYRKRYTDIPSCTRYCLFYLVKPLKRLDLSPKRGFNQHGYIWECAEGESDGLSVSHDDMEQMYSLPHDKDDVATIKKRDGSFYIEVRHIKPVRKHGQSSLGNLLVLCPNHHKEFDFGHLEVTEKTVDNVRGILNGTEFEIQLPHKN